MVRIEFKKFAKLVPLTYLDEDKNCMSAKTFETIESIEQTVPGVTQKLYTQKSKAQSVNTKALKVSRVKFH